MNAILLGMLKALPMNVLIDLFLDLAEDFSKSTDNQLDDKGVALLRALFPPRPAPGTEPEVEQPSQQRQP